jgi:hypothetical protein
VVGEQSAPPTQFAFELPDKFMKKDVLANVGAMTITRTSGFNGDAVINVIDQPPPMAGNVVMFKFSSGGGAQGELVTSEQKEAARKSQLVENKQDFARLMLGILLASPAAYPLQFAYGGQANRPTARPTSWTSRRRRIRRRLFIDTAIPSPDGELDGEEPLTALVFRGWPGAQPDGARHARQGGRWSSIEAGRRRGERPQ